MKRLPHGLKKHTGGWWSSPMMRRSLAADLVRQGRADLQKRTPEQVEAERRRGDKLFADFVDQVGWNNPSNADQARAIEKLTDREARVSVEGDTDLNHDNLEDPA